MHAHLPFVRHPEYEDFLEERWLYEAITETYLPLLEVFERLRDEGVGVPVTISITPTLAAMLTDPLLQGRYIRYIERLVELSEREVQRTRWLPEFQETARMYQDRFRRSREAFVDRYRKDLTRGFQALSGPGGLDIMTCAATHGFLPLLATNESAVRAQIRVAARSHRSTFGKEARGIWLPECGFVPGVDRFLAEEGLRYFLVDAHGVLTATPTPPRGVFEPVRTPAGVAAFGRDIESSRSVWSASEGYPGDPEYRDFYRDIGFDLELDYVRPYIHESGLRIATGLKYHRITGPTDEKHPYSPSRAAARVSAHVDHFVESRLRQLADLGRHLDRPPIIVSPYDAELFGHWWYEGPLFVEGILRRLHRERRRLEPVTLGEYLERHPGLPEAELAFSSWGHHGFGEVWLNESNDWIYRHLHKAADRMESIAARFRAGAGELQTRVLNQMARELLLAQASDWAFIMTGKTAVEYAVRRTNEHVARFNRLHEQLVEDRIDLRYLRQIEDQDNLFREMDYRVYC